MGTAFHYIKIGNQTNKPLTVVANGLEPKIVQPEQYVEWDVPAILVDAHVSAQDRNGQRLDLGHFEYDNTKHNYADIIFTSRRNVLYCTRFTSIPKGVHFTGFTMSRRRCGMLCPTCDRLEERANSR